MFNESNVIDPITKKYLRSGGNDRLALEQYMQTSYDVSHAIITTSGMHANTSAIIACAMHFKWNKFNIVYSNEMYCDTSRFIENYKHLYGNIETWPFHVEDTEYLLDIFNNTKNKLHVLFVESVSNPNSRIFDFSLIPQLRKLSSNLIVIVDNTWMTHFGLNPFDYDVDIVTTSLTKYYSAGTSIAGAILFKSKKIYDIAMKRNVYEGYHVAPDTYRNLLQMVQHLESRITTSSDITMKIVQIFRDKLNSGDCRFISVNHTDPSNAIVQTYLKNNIYPSVFTIKIKCKLNTFKKAMKRIEEDNILPIITSFGSSKTKLDPYPNEINEEFMIFRIAVGYDDVHNVNQIVNAIDLIINLATN